MAVTTQNPAPYAPTSAILEIIKRYRDRGLPTPINAEVLGRAGIASSLISRTLQALETLDLIDDKGLAKPTLEGLRRAAEGEFKQRLAEWLNGAYADVLNFVDPATADTTAIRDAFRSYNPVGQQSRMVTLFEGLYAAAGIGPNADKKQPISRPATRSAQPHQGRPRSTTTPVALEGGSANNRKNTFLHAGEVPPPLAGLLASVPFARGGWTKEERERFVTTFAAVLDYCLPVVEASEQPTKEEEMFT